MQGCNPARTRPNHHTRDRAGSMPIHRLHIPHAPPAKARENAIPPCRSPAIRLAPAQPPPSHERQTTVTAVTSGMLGGIRAALHTLDELKYATDYRLSLDECSGRSFSPSEPVSADIIDLECMASKTIRTAIRWFHIVPPHGASPRELATTLSNIPDFDELLPPAIMSELACLYAALAAYLAHTKHE